MKSLDPGTLKKLVNHLVPTQLHGDNFFMSAFLETYRRFTTLWQVLDQLLLRCAPLPRQGTHRLLSGS